MPLCQNSNNNHDNITMENDVDDNYNDIHTDTNTNTYNIKNNKDVISSSSSRIYDDNENIDYKNHNTVHNDSNSNNDK